MNKPIRVQLRRTKGWKMPPNTMKVDRSTRGGNPFKPRKATTCGCRSAGECGHRGLTLEESVELFKITKIDQMRFFPETTGKYLEPLRGKNLACWCPLDQPCHADVLLEIANDHD